MSSSQNVKFNKKKTKKTSYSQNTHSLTLWDVAVHKTQAASQHNFSQGNPVEKIKPKQVSDDTLYSLGF